MNVRHEMQLLANDVVGLRLENKRLRARIFSLNNRNDHLAFRLSRKHWPQRLCISLKNWWHS